MIKNATVAGIISATLIPATSFLLNQQWTLGLISLGVGLFWLMTLNLNWPGGTSIGFLLLVGLIALSVGMGFLSIWMLPAVGAALAAWDLSNFTRRLNQTQMREDEAQLTQVHLRRVLVVIGLGLLLGGATLNFTIYVNLPGAVLLGLLLTVTLGWAINTLKNDHPQY